jgi:hypothetical protein
VNYIHTTSLVHGVQIIPYFPGLLEQFDKKLAYISEGERSKSSEVGEEIFWRAFIWKTEMRLKYTKN